MQNIHLKQQLRTRMRALRTGLPDDERAALQVAIAHRLSQLPAYQTAASILAYVGNAAQGEIETIAILKSALESGKLLALPRVLGDVGAGMLGLHRVTDLDGLILSKLGIFEPPATSPCLTLNDINLIIIPGSAFDRNGNRLGAGGGFYDRLLIDKNHPTTVALAFDFQIVDAVPKLDHDVAIDFIITESQTIDCRK